MDDRTLEVLEGIHGITFPENFKMFLKEHAGLSFYENIYFSKGIQWEVKEYLGFKDMFKLSKEFKENEFGKKIPFAFGSGGWHFCLDISAENFNSVWIYRWTDYEKEDAWLKIADSFEGFVNHLSDYSQIETKDQKGNEQATAKKEVFWNDLKKALDSLQVPSGFGYGKQKLGEIRNYVQEQGIVIIRDKENIMINSIEELQNVINTYDSNIIIKDILG